MLYYLLYIDNLKCYILSPLLQFGKKSSSLVPKLFIFMSAYFYINKVSQSIYLSRLKQERKSGCRGNSFFFFNQTGRIVFADSIDKYIRAQVTESKIDLTLTRQSVRARAHVNQRLAPSASRRARCIGSLLSDRQSQAYGSTAWPT